MINIDIIAKIIQDLKDGVVTEDYVLNMLEFKIQQQDVIQNKKERKIAWNNKEYFIEEYLKKYVLSPEKLILEKERQSEIIDLLEYVFELIGERGKKILWLYIVEGKTQEQIAKIMNVRRTAITMYLQRIQDKIRKNVTLPPHKKTYIWDIIYPVTEYEADKPEPMGYPYEIEIGKKPCGIPEYLEQCFKDKNTKCTLCKKCRRKE